MSTIRLLVLGAIKRHGTAHGYRVYRDAIDWHIDTWTSIRPGSIYHALSQLEIHSFIAPSKQQVRQKLGPSRTEYHLTPKGEQEFMRLLEVMLTDTRTEELSVAIAFMEFLPRTRVVALLQERLAIQRANAAFLGELPTEKPPTQPSKHPALIRLWTDYLTYAATSTTTLLKSIQAGAYTFKDT